MTQWYTYKDSEVQGPFEQAEICEMIDRKTLVCPAGTENWEAAGQLPELSDCFSRPTDSSPDKQPGESLGKKPPEQEDGAQNQPESEKETSSGITLEPTLQNLRTLCQHATDSDLEREYNEFWDEYDKKEQRLLRNEMGGRGIWLDITGENQEQSDWT